MRKIFIRIRNILLWIVLILLIIWIMGSAGFLLSPKIQRFALRIVLKHYDIPVFIDYNSAKLAPGHFVFTNFFLLYTTESDTITASADSLVLEYSFGKPIIVPLLRFVKPVVTLKSGESTGNGEPSSFPKLPEIKAERIEIVEGKLDLGSFSADSFNFFGICETYTLTTGKSRIKTHIDSISGILHKMTRLNNATGDIIMKSDTLYCDVEIRLDSTETNLIIEDYRLADNLFKSIYAEGERVSLNEIDSLFGFDFLEGSGAVAMNIFHPTKDEVSFDFSFDGFFHEIPITSDSIHICHNNKTQTTVIASPKANVWDSDADSIVLIFYSAKKPIEYHFTIGQVRDFNLDVFDITPSSLTGFVEIFGTGLGDYMQMSVYTESEAGEFDDYKFDGGIFHVHISENGVEFPTGIDTSFVVIGIDTALIWGAIDTGGYMDISTIAKIHDPDTVFKSLGYDFDISGNFYLTAQISGYTDKPGIDSEIHGKNNLIYGLGLSNVFAKGRITDLSTLAGEFIISGESGKFNSIPIDSVNLSITMGQDRIYFRPLSISVPLSDSNILPDSVSQSDKPQSARLRATGMISYTDSLNLRLDGLTIISPGASISLLSSITASLDNGFECGEIQFSALSGVIEIDTLLVNDSILVSAGRFEGINLQKLSFLPGFESLSGNIKGHFSSRLDPRTFDGTGEFDIFASPIAYENFVWSSLSANGNFLGDTLYLNHCYLRRPEEAANAQGWAAFDDSIPDFHLELSANGRRPGFLEYFAEDIMPKYGKYVITLFIDGNLDSLELSGTASLDSGIVEIKQINDPIENITLAAKLHGTKIDITEFYATSKTIPPGNTGLLAEIWSSLFGRDYVGGYISATGTIDLKDIDAPQINMIGLIKNFPFHSTSDGYYMLGDGQFELVSPVLKFFGDFVIIEGNILQLGSVSPEPTIMPLPIDIAVSTDNIWLLTDDMEAKIEGEIFVTAADNEPSILGNLNISDGKYFVYGQTFDVNSGVLDFNKISLLDPDMDIMAQTNIGEVDIMLHITGTLLSPLLEIYSSNQEFTQQDILTMLIGISDSTNMQDALEDRTQAFLQQYLSYNIERIAQKTLGVDEFEIEPASQNGSLFNPSDLRLTVGKRITGGLSLRYSQTLSDSAQQEVEVEYRFSRHFTIGAMQTAEGYKMNLKFKWEY